MKRIDTTTKHVDKFGAGKHGFKDGNTETGDPATALNAAMFDMFQEEMAAVVEGAGMALNPANNAQMFAAINSLIAASTPAGVAYLGVVQAWTRAQRYAVSALVDGASIAWDLDTQPLARVTLGGNRTFAAPSNIRDGGFVYLEAIQDGTGNRTAAWNAVFDFGLEGLPVLPTAAGKSATFVFQPNATSLRCVGRWSN